MNEKQILEYDEKAKKLCLRLKEIRESKGWSKNHVAELSGLSWAAIMRIEKGERIPTISTLMRICDALKVRLPKLLQEVEKS